MPRAAPLPARRSLPRPLALAATLAGALLAGAAVATAQGTASPWSDHEVVAARLLAAPPAADGELRFGLHVRLAPGWHVYWKNPGDAGLPPVVALAADGTPLEPRLLFPAPERYHLPGDLVALGYSGEVVYPLRARPAAGPPPRRIVASVDYLACEDECIPFHDELELVLPVAGGAAAAPAPGGGGDGDPAALIAAWEARVPRPVAELAGVRTGATLARQGDEGELVVTLDGVRAAGDLFLEAVPGLATGDPAGEPTATGARFRVPVRPEVAGEWPRRVQLAWTATGVDTAAASGLALEGVVEPAEPAGGPTAAAPAATARPPRLAALPVAVRGALLAITPASLALLVLLGTAPAGRRPVAIGAAAAVSGVVCAAALLAAGAVGRRWGVALPLAEPLALAALAVPSLALPLALWGGRGDALRRLPAPALAAGAALLALPWTPPLVPAAAGPGAVGAAAAGLALAAGLVVAVASRLPASLRLDGALGFVAAGAMLWISHRLGAGLLRHELALVQLLWLAVALFARLATEAAGARRHLWWSAAGAAAVASLWFVR